MFKYSKFTLIILLVLSNIYIPVFASKEYTGTIISLEVVKRTVNYDAAYEGGIGYVATPGALYTTYITNLKGNKVIQGAPLYKYVLPYWEGLVKEYEDYTKTSKVTLEDAKIEYDMAQKLVKPGAVSVKTLDDRTDKYITALKNYEKNKAMINVKYEDVREAVYRPPFEGMLTKIYETGGVASGGYVIEYTQLNPIGISVKMDRNEAKKLYNKPVKIFPAGKAKPQGILYGRTLLTDDGVTFITENSPLSTINDPDSKIKIHRDYALVWNFDLKVKGQKGPTLCVNKKAILKDSDGYFVWIIDGYRDMSPDKGINNIFTASKVYITPDNLFKSVYGHMDYQALKKHASLKLYDIALLNPPKDYKEGEKLFLPINAYILTPGEKVKVVVGR